MSLGLLGAYCSSSSESDEECDNNDKINEIKLADEPTDKPKLANPFMKDASKSLKPSYMVQTEDLSASKQKFACEGAISVFNNPFRAKEDRKRAILEQHVEMTAKQEDQTTKIGSRKICWNFRKGRCRFGHKCTFAHDSDVASSLAAAEERAGDNSTTDTDNISYSLGLLSDNRSIGGDTSQLKKFDAKQMNEMFEAKQAEIEASETTNAVISNNKRQTRPGLGDDVVPGKKARKFYNKMYGNNL